MALESYYGVSSRAEKNPSGNPAPALMLKRGDSGYWDVLERMGMDTVKNPAQCRNSIGYPAFEPTSPRMRRLISNALFDANGEYYETQGDAIGAVRKALATGGIDWKPENEHWEHVGYEETKRYAPIELPGGYYLHMTLYRMPSGKYELTAYADQGSKRGRRNPEGDYPVGEKKIYVVYNDNGQIKIKAFDNITRALDFANVRNAATFRTLQEAHNWAGQLQSRGGGFYSNTRMVSNPEGDEEVRTDFKGLTLDGITAKLKREYGNAFITRMEYPWGRTPTWMLGDGRKAYSDRGEIFITRYKFPQKLAQRLVSDWRPSRREDEHHFYDLEQWAKGGEQYRDVGRENNPLNPRAVEQVYVSNDKQDADNLADHLISGHNISAMVLERTAKTGRPFYVIEVMGEDIERARRVRDDFYDELTNEQRGREHNPAFSGPGTLYQFDWFEEATGNGGEVLKRFDNEDDALDFKRVLEKQHDLVVMTTPFRHSGRRNPSVFGSDEELIEQARERGYKIATARRQRDESRVKFFQTNYRTWLSLVSGDNRELRDKLESAYSAGYREASGEGYRNPEGPAPAPANDMMVAKAILAQLGGHKFLAMTGAAHLVGGPNSLSMKIGRNNKGINHVMITLDPSDTYTMKFYHVRGANAKIKDEHEGVYAEDLQRLFTQSTGMYTSMGTVGRRNPAYQEMPQAAWDAGKNWALYGAAESGVANARVRHYGFIKWYNSLAPASTKGWRKSRLEVAFNEGYAIGKEQDRKGYGGPRRNPEGPAADMYESFHGAPSEEIVEVTEDEHYHSHLASLGELRELKVATFNKKDVTITFAKSGQTKLCSNEEGTQLYIVGGDQSLDLKAMGLNAAQCEKDFVALGVLHELTYQTKKEFHKFQLVDYYHELGEETGYQPILTYDTMNKSLSISGGEYKIRPEGIVN